MFNTDAFVKRSIISIQNQNFSDFEIIIINDCSTDNSFSVVNILSINDKRIKILNNKKNMGQLFSRCIGTLMSKGKYIFPLDSDDMYLIQDTLYLVYTEMKKNNPDFLEFRGILSSSIEEFFIQKNLQLFRNNIKNNIILYQPTIAKNSYFQCSLQALSIKSRLFKKMIKIMGKKLLYEHVTYYEDCIIKYIIKKFILKNF